MADTVILLYVILVQKTGHISFYNRIHSSMLFLLRHPAVNIFDLIMFILFENIIYFVTISCYFTILCSTLWPFCTIPKGTIFLLEGEKYQYRIYTWRYKIIIGFKLEDTIYNLIINCHLKSFVCGRRFQFLNKLIIIWEIVCYV